MTASTKSSPAGASDSLIQSLRAFPYVLAPMASITNAPFRLVMKELGAGIVISELISATGLEYGGQKTIDLCRYFEGERPVGLQIFGEDAETLAQAASLLEKQGVDFIDINLGCPVPKVVKKGGGSALMRDPTKLYQILKTVKDAIQIPLTIKIRTGWDDCSINALECVHAGAEAGVTWVAIHGRTRAQAYEGLADWDLIASVKEKSPIPIIGNGDILTVAQAIERRKQSACDGIMIGRGALRNPFLFLEIRRAEGLSLTSEQEQYFTEAYFDYWRLIERHGHLIREGSNPFQVGIQMRKFLTWFSAGAEGASAFRKKLYEIPTSEPSTVDQVFNLGREFFNRPGFSKQLSYLREPFLQGGHG